MSSLIRFYVYILDPSLWRRKERGKIDRTPYLAKITLEDKYIVSQCPL